jgi:ribonuclease P protein component
VATASHKFSFPRRVRIINTDDYSSVFNFRHRISGKFLVIHYQYNALSWPRLGIVAAKKITPLAVSRNYMKRVIRELFRTHRRHNVGLANIDLIVRTQKTFIHADFLTIEKEFDELLLQLSERTGIKADNGKIFNQTD